MSFEELLPTIQNQSYYAVFRYDRRRDDKIQELLCQSFEKLQRDKARNKEITHQQYKCFVTQRSKELIAYLPLFAFLLLYLLFLESLLFSFGSGEVEGG